MLSEILGQDIVYNRVPMERSPEYWAGWFLAYFKWYPNKSFKEFLDVVPLHTLILRYSPYHETPEEKTDERIEEQLPIQNKPTYSRELRKLPKRQLSVLSGVPVRSINCYEQDCALLRKAQAETLYAIAKTLDCTTEDLLN